MGAQYEALKHDLTSQAASQAMRNALDAKDAELRKVRYEAESRAKQAEKVSHWSSPVRLPKYEYGCALAD